jgi:hypothetical protein
MTPTLVLTLATLGVDPTNPKYYPPTYIPAEAPFGYLYRPIFDVHPLPRLPISYYAPQPGDVLLMSDTNRLWTFLNRLALTGKPGHNGLVVRMPDGRLGAFESGYSDSLMTRVTPLEYRLNSYPGYVWVRRRTVPLTPDQDRRLTEFAMAADGTRYALVRFLTQATPLSPRGPLLTVVVGKPIGIGHRYFCSQSTVEALVYAGVIDGRTARPGATFPQDLFYDRSRNRYIDHHPPLGNGAWGPPQLWTPLPGTAVRGKTRPQPPAPWPGAAGAYIVDSPPTAGRKYPTPVVVGYVPGDPRPIPAVEYPPQRVGFFDRPHRLLRRH